MDVMAKQRRKSWFCGPHRSFAPEPGKEKKCRNCLLQRPVFNGRQSAEFQSAPRKQRWIEGAEHPEDETLFNVASPRSAWSAKIPPAMIPAAFR